MEFTRDDRGVSEVIGAILVFGLLITLLAVMQTYAVPLANADVEFNHNQEVQSDLVKFQETASRTASQGSRESTRVKMGTTYPARLLFFSPNNPSGTIRTVGDQDASVDNIRATNPTIAQYLDGGTDPLETKRIEYQPGYNEYRNPPTTVLEYGILYNDFEGDQIVENPGSVVNGNSINLMFFAGDLSRTSGTALSLDSRPTSAPARTVTVEPETEGEPVVITLPTRLSEQQWLQVLDDEISDGNVQDVNVDESEGIAVIELDGDVSRYSLRMPKIGVGSAVDQPGPRYMMGPNGEAGTVALSGVTEVTLEVRDEYNNPVRDETVQLALEDGADGELSQTSVETNSEGQVTVQYFAPDSGNPPFDEEIRASFANDPANDFDQTKPSDINYTVTVTQIPGPQGPEPSIDEFKVTDDSQGAILDVLDDDEVGAVVDWEASISERALDTVELRLINTETSRIADSVSYDIRGETQADDQEVELVDNQGECGTGYRVEIIVESTGGQISDDSDSFEACQV